MFDGESFLKAGWIHGLKLHQFSKGDSSQFLILGKVIVISFSAICLIKSSNFQVKHSQRMSGSSLSPWVVIENTGAIVAAHCTCMAG